LGSYSEWINVLYSLTSDDFYRFFIDKVAKIRYSTVAAPEPSYNAVPPGCVFGYFRSIDRDDVIKLIMSLPDKQRASDPMPTWLRKTCASDLMAPFVCRLFNASPLSGVLLFPSSFKSTYVTPILKNDAHRANHSTETATVKIVSDILMAFDHGDIAALIALLLGGLRHCGSRHPTSQAQRVVRRG